MMLLITYMWWTWWPIEIILTNMAEYRNHLSKYEALEMFVNQPKTIINGSGIYTYKTGEILFKNVFFQYGDVTIFENLSLTIAGQKTTALVGYSGAGKSTLVKLILRLYDVGSGEICIDSQPLKNVAIQSVYDHI